MTVAPSPGATDVPLSDLTGELLMARVARATLYLIDMEPGAGTPSREEERDHLAYLYKLEQDGRLYGSGLVDAEPGRPAREMAIVAAASRDEAELIAANEPLAKAGQRRNRVWQHTMNEGVACYVGRAMFKRAEATSETFVSDFSDVRLSYEDLAERAAGAQLYLLPLIPTEKPRSPEDTQTMDAHFRWLRDNEMGARLMSCGPVLPAQPIAPGIWGGGLGIVATSRPEAERIAALEPSGVMGYRALSVHGWRLDYGLAAPIAKALVTLNRLPR
jgi:uncharacterized protein YciI